MEQELKEQVTLVIKAFERQDALNRLLRTIKEWGYGDLPIIVVDDSAKPLKVKVELPDLRMIQTEYDIGLSAGRNVGLRAVKTPFFVILDDDMMFTARTRIDRMLAQIKRIPDCDILGGLCPGHEAHAFGIFERWQDEDGTRVLQLRFMRHHSRFRDYIEADYIVNFFIAKTESVLAMGGWPDEIKIGREHVVFLVMTMEAGLKVCINRAHRVGHGGAGYAGKNRRKRRRTPQYNIEALDRMECDAIRAIWRSGKAKFGWSRTANGYLWGKSRRRKR